MLGGFEETESTPEPVGRSSKGPYAIALALIGLATALVTAGVLKYLPIHDRGKTSENAITVAKAEASYNWKYEEFVETGGAGAAAKLSEPNEQPLPQDVYATAPAALKICVWWKPSPNSGYTYKYASILWDKNHPIDTSALPSSGQIPIGFGGKNYELFLFFSGTKSH